MEERHEPLDLNVQSAPPEGDFVIKEFHSERGTEAAPNVEHQFLSAFPSRQTETFEDTNLQIHSPSRKMSEEICISLQLSEPEPKRRKQSGDENSI